MRPASSLIVTNDGVSSAVTQLIREAKESVVLVSPYNSFWDHLRDAIRLAIKRHVQVTVIYREGEKENDDITWLKKEGATVYVVDRLHAKLYLNEASVLLTSMNLHQSSREKSREVGIHVDDADAQRELRSYVNELIHLGKRVSPAPASAQTRPAPSITRTQRKDTPTKASTTGGACIRCKTPISFNVEKPLCPKDYRTWNRHQDPTYPEKYCHRCGREYSTTFNEPLCLPCLTAS